MPSATDLVLKNAAAANKTFTLLTPASGYGSVAEWALKEGAISSVFPRLTASATSNAAKSGVNRNGASKKLQVKFRMPSSYQDTVTGITNVSSAFEFNGSFTVPADFPESLKADAAAYVGSALTTALFQAMMKDGLPAT